MKSGFISIVGRPNVGKSTLLNNIIGSKVAITSDKPQTTRNIIKGIYNEEDIQMVFLDTPGIHKPNHKLGTYLNKESYSSMNDADAIMFLVDAKEGLGRGDHYIIERLREVDKPVILVINKIDSLSKEVLFNLINEYKDLYPFSDIVPVSALKQYNIKELIKVLKTYLKDEIKYYPDDDVTDQSESFLIGEIIREKVFNETKEEIPHAVTCYIEDIKSSKTSIHINGVIVVDRDSLKKIIVGANGSKIKTIGINARKELETIYQKKVYLELLVKTIKDWRDKEKYLKELGFDLNAD